MILNISEYNICGVILITLLIYGTTNKRIITTAAVTIITIRNYFYEYN